MIIALNQTAVKLTKNLLHCTLAASLTIVTAHTHAQGQASVDESDVVYDDDQKPVQDSADESQNIEDVSRHVKSFSDIEADKNALLANNIQSPSPIWLQSGGSKLLAFWQEDLSGAPLGAVLILAQPGSTPLESQLLHALQQELPKFGWATLAIGEPAFLHRPPPRAALAAQKETSTEPSAETPAPESEDESEVVFSEPDPPVTDAAAPPPGEDPNSQPDSAVQPELAWQEYVQTAHSNLSAAMDFLQQKEQRNVALLGDGLGAYISLQYLSAQAAIKPSSAAVGARPKKASDSATVRALILLNLNYPSTQPAPSGMLNAAHIPVMDLLSGGQKPVAESPAHRGVVARKAGYNVYLRRHITPITPTLKPTKSIKLIRGFLNKYAGDDKP